MVKSPVAQSMMTLRRIKAANVFMNEPQPILAELFFLRNLNLYASYKALTVVHQPPCVMFPPPAMKT